MFLTFFASGVCFHWNADSIARMIEEGENLVIVDVHGVKHKYSGITDPSWSESPDLNYWQPTPNATCEDEHDEMNCRDEDGDKVE